MTNEEFNELFRKRTMEFAIRVLRFIDTIPVTLSMRVVTFQLGKASTSVGANYRAFCRGRSKNERFSKICIVVEEADESEYWLEVNLALGYGDRDTNIDLLNEATEILKVVSSIKNSMSNWQHLFSLSHPLTVSLSHISRIFSIHQKPKSWLF